MTDERSSPSRAVRLMMTTPSVTAMLVLLALSGCIDGGDGGDAGITINGTLVGVPAERQPVSDATVTGDGASAGVEASGEFVIRLPRSAQPRIVVQFADGSQAIYDLRVPASIDEVVSRFSADPVFGTAETAGVDVTPNEARPAGTTIITDPADRAELSCAPPPEPCRFQVEGTASLPLGQPGTPFQAFLMVTPVDPSGGFTFPQFPPISVDPETGAWTTSAQIGSRSSQACPGDRLQVLSVVTNEHLTPGTEADPLRFQRPVDVPGVVYISAFTDLVIGDRNGFECTPGTATETPVPTRTPSGSPPTSTPTSSETRMIAIAEPIAGQAISCSPVGNSCSCRLTLRGMYNGFDPDIERIYTLVYPIVPFGGGWFIQADAARASGPGTWEQDRNFIGSNDYGACEGHTLRVVAIATSASIEDYVGPSPFELSELPPHLQSSIVDDVILDRPTDQDCPPVCAQ